MGEAPAYQKRSQNGVCDNRYMMRFVKDTRAEDAKRPNIEGETSDNSCVTQLLDESRAEGVKRPIISRTKPETDCVCDAPELLYRGRSLNRRREAPDL